MKMIPLLMVGLFMATAVCGAQADNAEFTGGGMFRNKIRCVPKETPPTLSTAAISAAPGGFSSMSMPSAPEIAEASTPEIEALARGLENDPKKIFDFVHDHIQYTHYFGSRKGAQLTLLERSGNDFDQCALLVALLRSAGYTANYSFSLVSMHYENADDQDFKHWIGLTMDESTKGADAVTSFAVSVNDYCGFPYSDRYGSGDEIKLHRVWVQLSWNGTNYNLDPAFKVSEPIAGIDLANAMGLDTNQLMSVAGGTNTADYVQSLNETNITNNLRDYTTNFLSYLQSNAPNSSVEDVIGGRDIVSSVGQPLDQALPFTVFSQYTLNWDNIPTNLMATLSITLDDTTNRVLFMPQLQGQKLALTTSTSGVAQVWLEDEVLLQKQSGGGWWVDMTTKIDHPIGTWDWTNNILINSSWGDHIATWSYRWTNSMYAIIYAFRPDQKWLRQRQERLDQYLQQGLAASSREVLTETLNIMGLTWMLETEKIDELLATQNDMVLQRFHRLGSIGQEPANGYKVDIYQQLNGDYPTTGWDLSDWERGDRLFDLGGYFHSATEHAVIEQLQSTNLVAASTIKMLQIANANNQRIYKANSANWSSIQASLSHYTSSDLNWFKTNYIDLGRTLLLPANGSNALAGAGSWSGWGVLVARGLGSDGSIDMQTLISGGYHGGFVSDPNAQVNPGFVNQWAFNDPLFFNQAPALVGAPVSPEPVNLADGSYLLENTDLACGPAEPRGFAFTRYYSSSRRRHNTIGIASGWVHNYYGNVMELSAPLAGLGGTTPAQMAPLIVATRSAYQLYSTNSNVKNWTVTALIAKWGLDQLIKRAVSVSLGADTIQFVKQPDGTFTPPAKSTLTLTKNGSSYSLAQRHGNTFKFSSAGWLTNISDQYAQSLAITYNSSNWVSTVKDWKSRQLSFNYSGSPSRLSSISDSTRTVSYGYTTAAGQLDLTSITDLENKTSSIIYDTNHQVIATKDALNNIVVSNAYDGFGRVIEQYSQGDTNKTWRFYWSGFVNTEEDPTGARRRFYFDDKSRQIGQQDALGNTAWVYYDGQDQVVMTVSPLNKITQFQFDGRHNMVRSIDPLGFTNFFNYDSQDRLTSAVDARGNPTAFAYNPKFQVIASTNGAGDWVTNFFSATDGMLANRSDSGGTTAYSYDTQGYVSVISYPNNLGTERFLNNSYGDVLSHTNGRGFVTSFQYNKRRELTNTIAPTNVTQQVVYDAVGNVQSATDARTNTTTKYWSPTRKLLATVLPPTPQGNPSTTNSYDSRDWLARSIQNPLSAISAAILYTNDAAGRLILMTDPILRTSGFGYDADGHRLTLANAAHETNSQRWDARGSLVQSTDAAQHTIGRGFDAAGNLIRLTNRNQKVWQFYFDGANRLTNTVTPRGYSTKQIYNDRGLLKTIVEPSAQTANLYYDARGRLTNRTDDAGTTFYGYDANNNRTSVVENGRTNLWTFDAYDRVSTYTDADGNLTQYRRDANGNVTNLVYPGGKNVYYAFDSLNRLTNVTDWANRKTAIEYDLASRVKKITRPNGTVREMNYDLAGQLTNIWEKTGAGVPISMFKLNWNNAARVEWEFAAPLPHASTPPSRTMTYDDDNRILTFNGQNVTHDNDGNMTYGPLTNNSLINYVYDARNRLVSAGGLSYGYDPVGNRVAWTNGATTAKFIINPNTSLSQILIRIKNGVTNYYVYGLGLLYEADDSINTKTYHYDYRGSTVAITDGNGNVLDRAEYSAYGLLNYRTGNTDTPFLHNGQYGVQSDSNGLLYMRARYYNPYICRFINPDPVGFSGGVNFFAYADGNPIILIDPFGMNGNPVSGPSGPVGPSSPYDVGGVFYSPSPLHFTMPERFLQGAFIGAAGAALITITAPAAASGLALFMSETTASGIVTGGLLVGGGVGAAATGVDVYHNASIGNWNAVAFSAGTVIGGMAIGVSPGILGESSGGRSITDRLHALMEIPPSEAPNTWNILDILAYEMKNVYDPAKGPPGLGWLSTAPTPFMSGTTATGIGSGGPAATDWVGNVLFPRSASGTNVK